MAIIVRNFSLCRAVEETATSSADASEDKEEEPPMEFTRLGEGSDGRGDSNPEGEDENEEADAVLKDDDFEPLAPSQKQLNEITFESNKFGRFAATLVDGAKYRYRIHRRNQGDVRRWYRCVSRWTINCRATACYDVAANVITKLSIPHNHSPPFLRTVARYSILLSVTFHGYN